MVTFLGSVEHTDRHTRDRHTRDRHTRDRHTRDTNNCEDDTDKFYNPRDAHLPPGTRTLHPYTTSLRRKQ